MGRKPNLIARQLVLDEAEHVLHLKGYHATSIDDIAKACRMTKANIVHHFGSKKALALAVLDAKICDYQQRRVEPLCAKGDPIASVGAMFEEARRHFDQNGCRAGCFVGNAALEMSDVSEEFRKRVSYFFNGWLLSMSGCLQRAQKAGVLSSELNSRALAEGIVSLYEGAIMLARSTRDASVLSRTGKVAQALLQSYQTHKRRNKNMGPKTPCGC